MTSSTHPPRRAPLVLGLLALLLGTLSFLPTLTELLGVLASDIRHASASTHQNQFTTQPAPQRPGIPQAPLSSRPASAPSMQFTAADRCSPTPTPRLHLKPEVLLSSAQTYLLLTSSLVLAAAGLFLVHGSRTGMALLGLYLVLQISLLLVANYSVEPFWTMLDPENISFASLLLRRNPTWLGVARIVQLSIALGFPAVVLAVLSIRPLRQAVTPSPRPLRPE